MEKKFQGMTVLVSGAGGGFGLGATKAFAEAGANLIVTDYKDNMLEAAIKTAESAGARVAGLAGDISSEATSRDLVALAESEFGTLHVAVNNAGMAHHQTRLEKIETELAQRVMDVDVMGVFLAMKHQIPLMRKGWETDQTQRAIINVASIAGVIGAPMLSVYSAAKHAVVGLTRAAALENARKGLRINAICPAFTRTAMVQEALDTSPHGPEEAERRLTQGNPIGRLGEAEEIVQAIIWAASPENSFYTGQTLHLDGGLSTA